MNGPEPLAQAIPRGAGPTPGRRTGPVVVWIAAAVLVALAWAGIVASVRAERAEAEARAETDVANQALAFSAQLQVQFLATDQTLDMLAHEWESRGQGFDLADWRRRAAVLPGDILHLSIIGADGVVAASTLPGMAGLNLSDRDFYRYEASVGADDRRMFVGQAYEGALSKVWQVMLARRLSNPDGSFAGLAAAAYDARALGRAFGAADLGAHGMIEIVGARDGQVRAVALPAGMQPGRNVSGTAMFAALCANPDGRWSGPSPDGVDRLHAFREMPGRELVLVVGRARAEALRGSLAWTRGAIAAGCMASALILAMAASLTGLLRASRRREALLSSGQQALAAANAELSAARARADATAAGLEATIAGMSDGLTMVDGELRLVHWNEKAAEIAGLPRASLRPGVSIHDLVLDQARAGEFGEVDPEAEAERRLAAHWRDPSDEHLSQRTRPDGRTIEIRRRRLPDGGFVTLFIDVTARKQAEDALRSARLLAEAANEAKSRFVAMVSHEIRTPLNTLLNSLRMLIDGTGMRPEQRRLALLAGQSGEALLALLNDVLEMSRMEAGRLVLRPSAFALAPLMASVAEMFRAEAGERGLSLHVRVSEEVPEIVTTDPGRVRQVLINLVSNAVKFSDPGAIWLRASCGSGRAGEGDPDGGRACEPDGRGGDLRLTVEDPGPPICEHDRDRLFLPFSQLDQRSFGAAAGSGLGLSICQRLTALLGGRIGCDTTSAGGNAFWVRLPLRSLAVEEPAPAPVRRTGAKLPRTRVLLVEDVGPSRQVMATLLRRDGHAVDVADCGEGAVAAASRRPFDIVLMDVLMPGMGGLEAARAIRALPGAAARTPIVALTADVSDGDRAAFEAAGMQGAVIKPVEPETLCRALEDHVWLMRQPPSLPPSQPVAPCRADPASEILSERRLASLRDHLSVRTLSSLVDDCLGEIDGRIQVLSAAVARRDMQGAHDEAHALSGLAGSYGMDKLDRRLREVMQAARAGDPTGAAAAAERLGSDVADAARALRKALARETV